MLFSFIQAKIKEEWNVILKYGKLNIVLSNKTFTSWIAH